MTYEIVIGWDIGGAHLKAVAMDRSGRVLKVLLETCPLWQGLDHLHTALHRIRSQICLEQNVLHAITMTGELADVFVHRQEGVMQITYSMMEYLGDPKNILVFCGRRGFIQIESVNTEMACDIASANWLASGLWVASHLENALFIDIGSTTADILVIHKHMVQHRGYTDYERMRYDELVYTGCVRTPVMTLVQRVPFQGEWAVLIPEHFSTTADVYRITGELPEQADCFPAADHGPKTPAASRRRLARQIGRDVESASSTEWDKMADYCRDRQLRKITDAVAIQRSRGVLAAKVAVIGAGVGRFLVKQLAREFHYVYSDFSDLFQGTTHSSVSSLFEVADCAPAAAVAGLLTEKLDSTIRAFTYGGPVTAYARQ